MTEGARIASERLWKKRSRPAPKGRARKRSPRRARA
jgi:hypothetical protein